MLYSLSTSERTILSICPHFFSIKHKVRMFSFELLRMECREKNCRRYYRMKDQVPQQTVYSRKKKLLSGNPSSTKDNCLEVAGSLLSENTTDYHENNQSESIQYEFPNTETSYLDIAACTHSPIQFPTSKDDVVTSQRDFMDRTVISLYEGSAVSVQESHLLLSSYMCGHHLTRQACEDLLELLKSPLTTK